MITDSKIARAYFAAGCFWGVEEAFRKMSGVADTAVGYMGGEVENPTYEKVCGGKTGHAEAVEVLYDASVISYRELVESFFKIHDPTTVNSQGPDIGEQYRSVIFYSTEEEKNVALEIIEVLNKSGVYNKRIATDVVKAPIFYRAEEYHQKYLEKRGANTC